MTHLRRMKCLTQRMSSNSTSSSAVNHNYHTHPKGAYLCPCTLTLEFSPTSSYFDLKGKKHSLFRFLPKNTMWNSLPLNLR